MHTLAKQAEKFFMEYLRGGGKQNRKKQVVRIIEFLDWIESTEKVKSLHGIGKNHVIGFWKSHRDLSDATAYKYWLGLCKLWEWLGKHEEPPKPFKQCAEPEIKNPAEYPVIQELSVAIKTVREKRELSIHKLANLTGCEPWLIEAIESGKLDFSFADIDILVKTLGIQFTY
jgi:hypothetical protein